MKLEKLIEYSSIITMGTIGTIASYRIYKLVHNVLVEHHNQRYLEKLREGL